MMRAGQGSVNRFVINYNILTIKSKQKLRGSEELSSRRDLTYYYYYFIVVVVSRSSLLLLKN